MCKRLDLGENDSSKAGFPWWSSSLLMDMHLPAQSANSSVHSLVVSSLVFTFELGLWSVSKTSGYGQNQHKDSEEIQKTVRWKQTQGTQTSIAQILSTSSILTVQLIQKLSDIDDFHLGLIYQVCSFPPSNTHTKKNPTNHCILQRERNIEVTKEGGRSFTQLSCREGKSRP